MGNAIATEAGSFSLELPESVRHIQEIVREFAQQKLSPVVRELDETQRFPVELFREAGQLGLLGIFVPQEYGGAGLGYYEYVAAIMELGKVDGGFALSVAAHNSSLWGISTTSGVKSKSKSTCLGSRRGMDRGLGPHRAQYRLRCLQHGYHSRARRRWLAHHRSEKLHHTRHIGRRLCSHGPYGRKAYQS